MSKPKNKPSLTELFEKTLAAYPELRSKDISVSWEDLEDALMEVQPMDPEGWIIEVDKTLKDSSPEVIVGGIAHELAHIVRELHFSQNTKFWDKLLYRYFRNYRTLDERNTDLEAVLRGFAPELLAFMEESEKHDLDFYEEDGLSIRELKTLLTLKIS